MTNEHSTYDPQGHEPLPEGEEKAPPYTATMAIVRWVILGGMTLFAVVMLLNYFGLTPWSGGPAAVVQYHCPMHPTYISNQPGECPICGMTLVPVSGAGADSGKGTMADSAHDAGMPPHEAQPGQYVCPMHPEIISDQPGRCPKCGMYLERVPGETQPAGLHEGQGHADASGASVSGLVPVTIEPQRLQLIGVRTGTVSRRALDGGLRLLGFVTPDETRLTSVHVRFSGWVRELTVDQTGQIVAADQKLLSVYSQELYQAEQDYLLARQALQSTTDPDLRALRQQMFDASRRRLDLLGIPAEERLRLDTEGQPGAETWIRSPSAGVVLEKTVLPGQFIGPDQNLFTLADLSRVWVLADVYERDLAHIRVGQKVRMTTAAYAGETFIGSIGFIYPSVSEDTRTLKVRIEFANADRRLKPGLYAEIDLAGEGQAVLAVPSDAVMDEGSRQYAFVVHGDTHFEPRLLNLGRRSDDYVEVLSGLSEGEQVVTSANFLIDAESRLKAAMTGLGGSPETHADHAR